MKTSNGKTLFRVVVDGVDYGFMSRKARTELLARLGK